MIYYIKLILFFLFLFFNNSVAHAYLDPGTGSVFALIGSYIGFYWKKVKNFFKKFSKKKSK